jgi:hypothetical protein
MRSPQGEAVGSPECDYRRLADAHEHSAPRQVSAEEDFNVLPQTRRRCSRPRTSRRGCRPFPPSTQ